MYIFTIEKKCVFTLFKNALAAGVRLDTQKIQKNDCLSLLNLSKKSSKNKAL